MTKTLVVLADLGHLKAYRLDETEQQHTPKLEFLEQWDTPITHHLSEDLTDQAGRFRKGTVPAGPSDLSDGEQHNLDLERSRRAVKGLARHMAELVKREKPESCYFAAAREINGALLEALDSPTRLRIQKNVPVNLTHSSPAEVLAHFCE